MEEHKGNLKKIVYRHDENGESRIIKGVITKQDDTFYYVLSYTGEHQISKSSIIIIKSIPGELLLRSDAAAELKEGENHA